jgi:hypothetical protein
MEYDLETTEEAFDAIPPEVQRYIYSDDFDSKFQSLLSDIGTSEDNEKLLRGVMYGFIAQLEDEESVLDVIHQATPDVMKQQKIKDWFIENISKQILALITDAYVLEDEGDESVEISSNTPIIAKSLATLSDRLTQASIAAPMKRDISFDIPKNTAPETETPRPAIDPYHESIDNV